jgi:glycosyltransferase involved in cell wall biosynthesis
MYSAAFCYFRPSPNTQVRGVVFANRLKSQGHKIREVYFYSKLVNNLRNFAIKHRVPYLKTACDIFQTLYYRIIKKVNIRIIRKCTNVYLVKYVTRDFLMSLKLLKKSNHKCNVIYDFDDAVWLPSYSISNYLDDIMQVSDHITCENKFLSDYIYKKYNSFSVIVNSYFDQIGYYKSDQINNNIVIGWIGGKYTYKYIRMISQELNKALEDNLNIKLILAGADNKEVVKDFSEVIDRVEVIESYSSGKPMYRIINGFDIGLFPCEDNDDCNGRGFLKRILYMGCGAVPISSRIKEDGQIIKHNVNGLICNEKVEWSSNINYLINNKRLLNSMKKSGLKFVTSNYNLDAALNALLSNFKLENENNN